MHWIIQKNYRTKSAYLLQRCTDICKDGKIFATMGRGFVYICAGEEKLWIPTKLRKSQIELEVLQEHNN